MTKKITKISLFDKYLVLLALNDRLPVKTKKSQTYIAWQLGSSTRTLQRYNIMI